MTRPRVAFVFAAGGSLGAVEVGMLKALVAAGVTADLVVGASVGALNAAYFASDPTPDAVGRLERIWRGIRRKDVFPVSIRAAIGGVLARRDYLVSSDALRSLIRTTLRFRQLEEARIPCHVMATDALDGSPVRFSSGPALDALLASAAIPGVFPPVRLGSRLLVDGAVAGSTPLAAAVELGAQRVIALSPGLPCAANRTPHGPLGVSLNALNLLMVNQLLTDLQRLRGAAEIILVPPLCPLAVSSFDFSHTGELIDRAAASTRAWLDAGGLDRRTVPEALRPHTHPPAPWPRARRPRRTGRPLAADVPARAVPWS